MYKLPIYRTQLTPSGKSGSVHANIDVNTGAGLMGQALEDVGGRIFDIGEKRQEASQAEAKERKRLAKRQHTDIMEQETKRLALEEKIAEERQKAIDIKSDIMADSYIDVALEHNKKVQLDNPDTKEWERSFEAEMKIAVSNAEKLEMSDRARELWLAKTQARINTERGKLDVATTRRLVEDTKEASVDNLIRAVASGDSQIISRATHTFAEGFAKYVDPAEAKKVFLDASETGLKQRNKNAVQYWKNLAAANPADVIARLVAENELRTQGKESISHLDLANQDVKSVIDYAEKIQGNVKEKLASVILTELESAKDLDVADKDKMATKLKSLVLQSNYTDEQKWSWYERIEKRLEDKEHEALYDAKISVNNLISNVGKGIVSKQEAQKKILMLTNTPISKGGIDTKLATSSLDDIKMVSDRYVASSWDDAKQYGMRVIMGVSGAADVLGTVDPIKADKFNQYFSKYKQIYRIILAKNKFVSPDENDKFYVELARDYMPISNLELDVQALKQGVGPEMEIEKQRYIHSITLQKMVEEIGAE